MIRPGEQGRFVLRAWPQDAGELGKLAVEILLGSILFERVEHPLNQLSLPTRTHDRTCNGDALLSSLTNSLKVAENLLGPERPCTVHVVLAWAARPECRPPLYITSVCAGRRSRSIYGSTSHHAWPPA